MATTDYPIYSYPYEGYTSGGTLYESLGSFWTQLFQEKDTLKGYTLAKSEELIQSYINLVETIRSYSIDDVPVFHTERWYPLRIKKSEYNNVPLLFRDADDPEYAVFGPQAGTPTDKYYENVTFYFGYPKTPVADVYGITVPEELKKFSVLSNRIINPSIVLTAETDYRINGSTCYFNKDIFAMEDVPKYYLFNDDGTPSYYTNKQGQSVQDQEIILWAYNADIDQSILFQNFGYLFNINMTNSQFFKEILRGTMNLFVDGPTVKSIKSLAAAFMGVVPIIEAEEIIEDTYTVGDIRFIITNKNVYRCDSYYTILKKYRGTQSDPDSIKKGLTVYAGDILVDAVEYFDYVQSGEWWRAGLLPKAAYDTETGAVIRHPQMSFPSHLFVGNNKYHFIFKNEYDLVTRDANGDIHFPVEGDITDVANFHSHINSDTETRDSLADSLGLAVGGAISINPLDFVFQNFFKHGTAMIKLNFISVAQANVFTTFYGVIKNTFPKHVYLMFFLDFTMTTEEYELNENTTVLIDGVATDANSDGSSSAEATLGVMVADPSADNYSTDIQDRLFCFSKGIDMTTVVDGGTATGNYSRVTGFDTAPLPETIVVANTTSLLHGGASAVKDGALMVAIPEGASMRNVSTISLLNFS